jgi:hypothetical protein
MQTTANLAGFATIDYTEVNRSGVVHASQAFANTAFCGAPLVGHLRPRKAVHLNCQDCQRARVSTSTLGTRRCIDSDTQVMIPAKRGDIITCGNCGQPVTVVEKDMRPDDPTDHNTWLAIAEHMMSGD